MEIEEIKTYLKIDDNEEDLDIQNLIEISQIYIDSMVGENYKVDLRAVKLATIWQRKLIADMHKNRSTTIPKDVVTDKIVTSISDKLSNYEEVII